MDPLSYSLIMNSYYITRSNIVVVVGTISTEALVMLKKFGFEIKFIKRVKRHVQYC